MKKIVGFGIALLVLACVAYPSINSTSEIQEEGINFIHQDFDAAIKKAKAENKLIFVDAYASWCGPCKLMDKKTFKNKQVADYFNEQFVSVKIMIEDSQSATPEGIKFASKYKFDAYPTMFFIDKDGKVKTKIIGFYNAEDLLYEAKMINK